jgi:hypothetical protein
MPGSNPARLTIAPDGYVQRVDDSLGQDVGRNDTRLTIAEWASRREPNLAVSGKSEPEPLLLEYNLVAVLDDPADSRELLRKWERIQTAAGGVGFVAMSRSGEVGGPDAYQAPAGQRPDATTDAQKVSRHSARKGLRGAILGMVIGAVVIGLLALLLDAGTGGLIGAVLGGAMFGAVAGGVASFVAGTGWSEAYKESFVDPVVTDVVFASIHSDDAELIARAVEAADLATDRLLSLDRDGHATSVDPGV